MEAILTYLLKQSPTMVLMGIALYFMYKDRNEYKKEVVTVRDKCELQLDKKNDELLEMSDKVLKVALMWEVNSTKNSNEHELLITGVDGIKGHIKSLTQLANTIKDDCKG